jgi:hypothetical protein
MVQFPCSSTGGFDLFHCPCWRRPSRSEEQSRLHGLHAEFRVHGAGRCKVMVEGAVEVVRRGLGEERSGVEVNILPVT